MVISLLTNRPNGDNFTSSEVLQEFTKATNVRLRFIRPQTTFGHLWNVDQTVTRRVSTHLILSIELHHQHSTNQSFIGISIFTVFGKLTSEVDVYVMVMPRLVML